MTLLYLIPITMVLLIGWWVNHTAVDPLFPLGARRHRRCLANTDRLERELFPEWFEDEPAPNYTQVFAPGAVWQVDDPLALRAVALKQMAARGLLYSGEWQAALKRYEGPPQ